ncbi:MAG: DUF2779 domain-containing protein, partial [Clostridia bacterium]|nr:DUF2779 domain-containing protein [Clostridia bacterium]
MFYFSKSKYTDAWRCPKMVWLDKYMPEVGAPVDPALQSRFDTGNEVGDLAMGLFGEFVEVTAHRDDGKLDLSAMIEATRVEMERGTQNICEASFCYDGLYCAVDVLRREGGGWAIYEVKSSTHPENTIYHADVAYQKYILENCGVNVTGTYLVTVDNSYVFDGTLDLHALFKITDVADKVAAESANVESILAAAQAVLSCEAEPAKPLSLCCKEPYECKYCAYCWRDVPSPSVFDLYRLDSKVKFDLYRSGYASLDALAASGFRGTETQMRQIDFATHDRGTHVDAEAIGEYLDTLTYPL